MFCERCKGFIEPEDKYCPVCGPTPGVSAKAKKATTEAASSKPKKTVSKLLEPRYCGNCKEYIEPEDKYCSVCGPITSSSSDRKKSLAKAPKAKPEEVAAQAVDSSRGLKIALGVVGSIAIFLAGALVFGNNGLFYGDMSSSNSSNSSSNNSESSSSNSSSETDSPPTYEETLDACIEYGSLGASAAGFDCPPSAQTIKEALVTALAYYCSSPAEEALYKSSWTWMDFYEKDDVYTLQSITELGRVLWFTIDSTFDGYSQISASTQDAYDYLVDWQCPLDEPLIVLKS